MNPTDFEPIKSRQKAAASSGDHGLIGATLQIVITRA